MPVQQKGLKLPKIHKQTTKTLSLKGITMPSGEILPTANGDKLPRTDQFEASMISVPRMPVSVVVNHELSNTGTNRKNIGASEIFLREPMLE